MPTTIVAIDQSYTRLGWCAMRKRKVLEIGSLDLTKLRNPTQKRNCVRELVSVLVRKYEPNAVLVERVRTFAGGKISARTGAMLHSMTAAIVDAAYVHTFRRKPTPVFSVDTRAWKSAVLGNPSASKQDAVKFVLASVSAPNKKAPEIIGLDHDAADAYCIGRYVWTTAPKLKREK